MSQPPPSPYPPPFPQQPDVGYTPQYGFWPYYLTPPDALLGPARRASLMLFLLAALLLAAGTCVGVAVAGASETLVADAITQMRQQNPEQAEMFTPRLVRTMYVVMAAAIALCGLVAVILGVVVRSGSRAATITSLVLVLVPTAVTVLLVLGSLMGGPAAFVQALLTMLVPLVLFGMTIKFLISAIGVAGQVEMARQQMLMAHHHQHAQYQAQYQAYAQQPTWASPPPQGQGPAESPR